MKAHSAFNGVAGARSLKQHLRFKRVYLRKLPNNPLATASVVVGRTLGSGELRSSSHSFLSGKITLGEIKGLASHTAEAVSTCS